MSDDRPTPGTQAWLDQVIEPIVDPDQCIVDPHHHLWGPNGAMPYSLDDLVADVTSGHRVVATVFIECRSSYRADGPPELRSLGETEFVAEQSARLDPPLIRGHVGHIDLTRPDVDDLIDAHLAASRGLLRGIRHAGARDPHPEDLTIPGRGAEGLYLDPVFQAGVARLGDRGLTYDTWHYHHQNRDFAALARAVPDTTLVLDHLGTPLGVGRFAGKRDEIFDQWRVDIEDIATCPNVVAKLGGMAMPDNGWGWNLAERPPTSDEFVAAQGRWYRHMIDCFGPDRCMFESNFPVDRLSLSYHVFWNAAKKLIADFTPAERDAMLFDTAARVYRLDV